MCASVTALVEREHKLGFSRRRVLRNKARRREKLGDGRELIERVAAHSRRRSAEAASKGRPARGRLARPATALLVQRGLQDRQGRQVLGSPRAPLDLDELLEPEHAAAHTVAELELHGEGQ